MTDNSQYRAELALIFSLPIVTEAYDNSRLAGLQRKLQRQIFPIMDNLGNSDTPAKVHREKAVATKLIHAWHKEVCWEGKEQLVTTIVSLLALMVEQSTCKYDPKILNTLNSILNHIEKGETLNSDLCDEGLRAAIIWNNIIKQEISI